MVAAAIKTTPFKHKSHLSRACGYNGPCQLVMLDWVYAEHVRLSSNIPCKLCSQDCVGLMADLWMILCCASYSECPTVGCAPPLKHTDTIKILSIQTTSIAKISKANQEALGHEGSWWWFHICAWAAWPQQKLSCRDWSRPHIWSGNLRRKKYLHSNSDTELIKNIFLINIYSEGILAVSPSAS